MPVLLFTKPRNFHKTETKIGIIDFKPMILNQRKCILAPKNIRMLFLYNIVITIADFFLKIIALFNPKMKLFVSGRKTVFETLSQKINSTDKSIWFHAASLGEYEQGLPVIEKVREKFPSHKIVVTFFSTSGYEVRKNNTVADVTVYLPMDNKTNAKRFLKIVRPEMAFSSNMNIGQIT